MDKVSSQISIDLAEHLFRIEYGKIVSVLTGYLGIGNLKIAEDITQEAFLKAVKHWQLNGIPPNPKAWLYITAKNEGINVLKKLSRDIRYKQQSSNLDFSEIETLSFSDEIISDEQLKMMFVCCNPAISSQSQISLILKILCGFSISEIANAFFTTNETINKRLVRARKKLKENKTSFELPVYFEKEVPTIIQAIYLLFNEGYSPSNKDKLIRKELCFEAIRLAEILKNNPRIPNKDNCFALLSLMYLNTSRFDSRLNAYNDVIEMKNQNRNLWNKELINKGIFYLDKSTESKSITIYHILSAISANHCIAPDYESTNWNEILNLYDSLLTIKDSPIIRLNRSVALSNVKGTLIAISELEELNNKTDIDNHFLFHSTIAEFYNESQQFDLAKKHLNNAIARATNQRDIKLLRKKLKKIVPI